MSLKIFALYACQMAEQDESEKKKKKNTRREWQVSEGFKL